MPIYEITYPTMISNSFSSIMLEFKDNITSNEFHNYVETATDKAVIKKAKEKDKTIIYEDDNKKVVKYYSILEPMIEELEKMGFKRIKPLATVSINSDASVYEDISPKAKKELKKFIETIDDKLENE